MCSSCFMQNWLSNRFNFLFSSREKRTKNKCFLDWQKNNLAKLFVFETREGIFPSLNVHETEEIREHKKFTAWKLNHKDPGEFRRFEKHFAELREEIQKFTLFSVFFSAQFEIMLNWCFTVSSYKYFFALKIRCCKLKRCWMELF